MEYSTPPEHSSTKESCGDGMSEANDENETRNTYLQINAV